MHCLIVGMGALGQQLAQALLQNGHQVTGLRRTPIQLAGVQMLAQSVHQADLSAVLPIQQVYVILTPDRYDAAGYRQAFIDSIEPLRQALSAHPVARLYFISSTSVYGQDQGEWVDEQSATVPRGHNGRILLEAEQLWRQAYPEQLVLIRPSGIYGAGRLRLIEWLRAGRPVVTQGWTNRIHSEDLAGFLAYLASLSSVQTCYIATDSSPIQQDVILAGLAAQLAIPMVKREPHEVSGKRLSNQRLLASGYRLMYPDWQSGYQHIIKDF
ncbi:MAG: NAD-dependent epimerase/dehydratase family protein [Moraxellaceae bacterium]